MGDDIFSDRTNRQSPQKRGAIKSKTQINNGNSVVSMLPENVSPHRRDIYSLDLLPLWPEFAWKQKTFYGSGEFDEREGVVKQAGAPGFLRALS